MDDLRPATAAYIVALVVAAAALTGVLLARGPVGDPAVVPVAAALTALMAVA